MATDSAPGPVAAGPGPSLGPSSHASSNDVSTDGTTNNKASKNPMMALEKADSKVIVPKDLENDPFKHLPEAEAKILKDQVFTPDVKIGFGILYRYASRSDVIIIVVSAICAMASGAVLPLMTVVFGGLTNTFQGYFNGTTSYDEFEGELTKMVLYFVYLGIGEFVTAYVSTVGFIYSGEHISAKIREHYLEASLNQNIGYYDQLGTGTITTRITADANMIQDGLSEKVGLTLAAVATFVAAFIISFISYWKLTVILLSTVAAMMAVMGVGSRFIVKHSKANISAYAEGGSVAEEVISSVRNAMAFGTQARLAKQYDDHLVKAEYFGYRLKASIGILVAFIMTILYLNYGLAFWMGSRFIVSGEAELRQVLIVMMSVMMGAFSLGKLSPSSATC